MTSIVWVVLVPNLVTMVFSILAYSATIENRASIRKMECSDRNVEANTAALLKVSEAIEASTRAREAARESRE